MKEFYNKILYGGGVLFDLTKWVILFIVILVLIHKFVLTVFIVDGTSMEPSLHDKEAVFLQKNAYLSKNPQRGDVVVVGYPGDPLNKKYVKRVIALPGEKISISDNKVYINGKVLPEDYLPVDNVNDPDKAWQLKDNEYFLMGDNRPNSNDSRIFGPVEKRFFVGKAVMILYPRWLKPIN